MTSKCCSGLVAKYVGVVTITNFVFLFVIYCILLCAFVGQYIEHTKRHGVSNIKFVNVQQIETGLKKVSLKMELWCCKM